MNTCLTCGTLADACADGAGEQQAVNAVQNCRARRITFGSPDATP